MRNKKNQRGFTLLEILVVVIIIMLLAALFIPKLMQARNAASQAAAANSMEGLTKALAVYNANYGLYPAKIDPLSGTCDTTGATPTILQACLLDPSLVTALDTGISNGYSWVFNQVNSGTAYNITADPAPGNAAVRHFWTNGTGIHYSDVGAATGADPLIGN